MISIGVDITNISRFYNKSQNFIMRALSPSEISELNKLSDNYQRAKFLARSWAIKEAIFKADNTYINFSKINLQKDPTTHLWKFKDFLISISYADDYVIAFVQKN
ncbi:4'-phosphopantetheinyl transferase superfamily protein [Mycoplasmopsis verecunda]|uniref:Holo-[acyl-carrier protein] synthase n=1 Tax=Mycoplasmopsis verecunda TaxID=171291 RepID=A0A1T4KQP0_9BACT|nr:4'-phosphopantetheinyl transferase superfamily protein [Mycoplasmopsis verecunda]WPB54700.1 4'-phosphopantetheinyl transferase superfamily protein [Mycoplasmopsis verecunda]SJZ44668.1 holo-[acyl-carrier protein] synthase [Mycoplasmopsis verecunda]